MKKEVPEEASMTNRTVKFVWTKLLPVQSVKEAKVQEESHLSLSIQHPKIVEQNFH